MLCLRKCCKIQIDYLFLLVYKEIIFGTHISPLFLFFSDLSKLSKEYAKTPQSRSAQSNAWEANTSGALHNAGEAFDLEMFVSRLKNSKSQNLSTTTNWLLPRRSYWPQCRLVKALQWHMVNQKSRGQGKKSLHLGIAKSKPGVPRPTTTSHRNRVHQQRDSSTEAFC